MYNVQSRQLFTSRSSLAAFSISDALQMWNQMSSSVKDVMLNGDEFNTKYFHIIQIQNIEKKGQSKPSSRHRSLRLLLESLVVCQPSKSILAVWIFP